MKPEKPSAESLHGGQPTIQKLHGLLSKLLPEHAVSLNMSREYEWQMWRSWRKDEPFTEQDLRDVVAYRRGLIRDGRQFVACLKFHHLIGQPDLFEEDLALARTQRVCQVSDRDSVLKASGRAPRAQQPERMAGPMADRLLANLRAAASGPPESPAVLACATPPGTGATAPSDPPAPCYTTHAPLG